VLNVLEIFSIFISKTLEEKKRQISVELDSVVGVVDVDVVVVVRGLSMPGSAVWVDGIGAY